MAAMSSISIGSRVRVPLAGTKSYRRGIVATLQDDETASVLLEEPPKPPSSFVHKVQRRTPTVNAAKQADNYEDEVEVTVPVSKLILLLDFETAMGKSCCEESFTTAASAMVSAIHWKEHGDALLKLGDTLAAMGYYQTGLCVFSHISVGSAIIFKQKGFTKLAEVDCVDEDGESLDITLLADATELTIRRSDVLLCIATADKKDRVQERLLLNLARCCLQAADLVSQSVKQKSLFIRSAVLACSLAMDVCRYHDDDESNFVAPTSSTIKTALVLRSKAQSAVSKYDHAKADLKRVMQIDPEHVEARRLMQQIERTIQRNKKSDKKLVKELCKWVDVATSQSTKL